MMRSSEYNITYLNQYEARQNFTLYHFDIFQFLIVLHEECEILIWYICLTVTAMFSVFFFCIFTTGERIFIDLLMKQYWHTNGVRSMVFIATFNNYFSYIAANMWMTKYGSFWTFKKELYNKKLYFNPLYWGLDNPII